MSRVDRGVADARVRRRGLRVACFGGLAVILAGLVALGEIVAAGVIVLIVVVLGGLVHLVLLIDRDRRDATLRTDQLASAAATIRADDFKRLKPASDLVIPDSALVVGNLFVGLDAIEWRPSVRFAKRGVSSLVWPWASVDRIEAKRLRSTIPCDVLAIVANDSTDAILYVTGGRALEDSIERVGGRITRP